MGKPKREGRAGPSPLPDRKQREIILRELDRNILVESAAGTGKTTSMVGRMLALLRTGRCGSIRTMAAVTFTRKAAAELRARFQVELERALRDAGGEERGRLEDALEHAEQCFIGTIHSFCARLLRERPVEAGVDLAFEEIDEEADMRLRAEAWEAFTAGLVARDDHGFTGRLSSLGLGLSDLRAAFDSFTDFPDVDEWPLPPGTAQPDLAPVRRELERYIAHISAIAPFLPHEAGNDALIPELKRLPRVISHYDGFTSTQQLMEVLELFDRSKKIVQREWKKTGRFSAEDAKVELAAWDAFRADFVKPSLREWREMRYAAVLPVLEAARGLYDDLRRERGQLNFQDLLMKAAALLRDNPAVRRYFRSRFTHLLVDEFQDTDPVQTEVIMLLCASDPREADWRECTPTAGSLFLVGDPKQSIYRFRRADIITYNEAREMILCSGGLVVNLSANFRAAPPIISWVNDVFEPGRPPSGTPGRALLRFPRGGSEASPAYVPLVPAREGGEAGFSGIYRLCVPEEAGDKESAVEYEADLIARFIRYALDGGISIPRSTRQSQEGKGPEGRPDDFMIVTRNTGKLSTYARALQGYGIPHRVTGGQALNEVEELRLFRDCLQAVVNPDDQVALLAVLRGGLFGLSDRALYAFRKAGGSFSYHAPLPGGLSPQDAAAVGEAFERLRGYSLWLSRLPFAAACEKIAADLGLPALAASRSGGDIQAGSLGKALSLLRGVQPEAWSSAQLAEHLRRLVEREEKHDGVSALSGAHPAVRVMNLHKVKGLEAPVVFLADPSGESEHEVKRHIDRSGNKVLGFLAVYRGGARSRRGRLLAHPADWESLVERERDFERAEALRLRYVAATRAGCATVITQRARRNNNNPWCYFEPYLEEGCDLPDPGPQEPPTAERSEVTPQEAAQAAADISSRLETTRRPTYDALPLKEYALSAGAEAVTVEVVEEGECEAASPTAPTHGGAATALNGHHSPSTAAGEHGVEWGGVVHLLLQAAMEEPGADLESLAAAALAQTGLPPSLAAQAAVVARSVTASHIWQRAMRSDAVFVEVPLQLVWDDVHGMPTIVRGVIDLVFKERDDWVIVDYKTDRPGSGGHEGAARRYAAQVLLYARAWEKCTGELVTEAYLYFTSDASLIRVGGLHG